MGMKRRYLAVLMGIMVATTSVPAMVYAEDSKTETAADAANDESGEADASDESQENVVLGEVKSVSDSEITIAVGTMKEMGQPGGDGQNGGAPDGNGQGGEAPSMLDLTGEEQTITITADTVITKQAGGMQPGGDGQNGGAPEKPEGDGQSSDSLMEQVTVRTQLTITRKVRIQIARTEKSRKNQTVTDSPQRLRRFHFLTFRRAISFLSL